MPEYILALDQGTTSSRALLFDRDLQPRFAAQREFPQLYPRPGWVEHDPEVLWQSQLAVLLEVVERAGCGPEAIAALAVANQRETVVVWDRRTGKPIHNAIVWQCRRTADRCAALQAQGRAERIRAKTGLVLDAYFSATKIEWILDHVAGARAAARRGDLLCGTIDSWLVWKLSGGQRHVTDFTNASRTLLFDIHDLRWDEELLDLFGIPASMLPAVVPSSGIAAEGDLPGGGLRRRPIAGLAGDQQAALFGQGCFEPGQAKNTYGTGCFLLTNVGGAPVVSRHGLLTTLTAQTRPGAPAYALEGSVFSGGAVLQWLRDELNILTHAAESDPIARSIPDTGGGYVV
ncbi:MAG: FGGY family carbohydrate kinase, partial [Kiritimatiellia bacterium]